MAHERCASAPGTSARSTSDSRAGAGSSSSGAWGGTTSESSCFPFFLAGLLQSRRRSLWLGWAAGGVAGVLVFFNLHVVHDYYQAALTPIAAAIAGVGASALFRHPRLARYRHPVAVTAVVGLLVAVGVVHDHYYWERAWRDTPPSDVRLAMARSIEAHTLPGERVAVVGFDWSPEVLYYARRKGIMFTDGRHDGHDARGDRRELPLARGLAHRFRRRCARRCSVTGGPCARSSRASTAWRGRSRDVGHVNVVVLTTSYPRHADDVAGVFVRDAVEALRAAGHHVTVVSPATFRHYGIAYGDGIVNNLRRRPWLVVALPLFLLSYTRAARRAAKGADVVHAHWLPSAIPALATRRPFVLQLWGSDVVLAARAAAVGPRPRASRRRRRLRLDRARGRRPRARRPRRPGHPLRRRRAVGRVAAGRAVRTPSTSGGSRRRRASASSRTPSRGLPLVVVGDGPLRALFPQRPGFVPPAELGGYYRRAALLVAPSRREGYGVAAREAMAHGRPVVATDVGGLRDAVQDGVTGLVVAPGQPGRAPRGDGAPPRRRRAPVATRGAARAYAEANLGWEQVVRRLVERTRPRADGESPRRTPMTRQPSCPGSPATIRACPWPAAADEGSRHRRRRLRRREPLRLARDAPSRVGGRRARQPPAPRLRAQPAAPARRRRAVRARRRARARRPRSRLGAVDALVECSAEPSVLAGLDGGARLPRPDEPRRRVQLPRAAPPRRRAARLPLDEPRLPGRGAARRSPTRRPRRASSSPTSSRCRARRRAASPRSSRSTGARTLYGATKLAAELLIAEYVDGVRRCATVGQPLRRDRRARGRWARSTRACSRTGCSRTTSAGR